LEQENSWLKSELLNIDKSFRVAEGKQTSFQEINTQDHLTNDLKGNLLLSVPEYDEIRKSLDFDQEALVIPDAKS